MSSEHPQLSESNSVLISTDAIELDEVANCAQQDGIPHTPLTPSRITTQPRHTETTESIRFKGLLNSTQLLIAQAETMLQHQRVDYEIYDLEDKIESARVDLLEIPQTTSVKEATTVATFHRKLKNLVTKIRDKIGQWQYQEEIKRQACKNDKEKKSSVLSKTEKLRQQRKAETEEAIAREQAEKEARMRAIHELIYKNHLFSKDAAAEFAACEAKVRIINRDLNKTRVKHHELT